MVTGQAPPDFDAGLDLAAPHDMPAEQSALGGMLLSKDAAGDVVGVIRKPSYFYRPAHQMIFEVVRDLYGRGEPTDTISVGAQLGRLGLLERCGGGGYLHTLISSAPTAANAGYYARIVAEKAVLRGLVEAGIRITQIGRGHVDDVPAAVARAQDAVHAVTVDDPDRSYAHIANLLSDAMDAAERRPDEGQGVPSGYADLDAVTGGFRPGEMWIIAARPAVGKTTAAIDAARSAAIRHGLPTAFFSLEMSRQEVVHRILAAEARVLFQSIREANLGDDDWARIASRLPDIAAAPLFIDDTASTTVPEIAAKARHIQARHGLRLLVLDYLQLLASPRRVENRQQEVSEISRSVKVLAKDLGIPVVALSQLNRQAEARADKRPHLSDLRESGSLEQDSDGVILLYREDAAMRESARVGEADFIVAKNRNGPVGTVTVAFQGHYARFVDMAV